MYAKIALGNVRKSFRDFSVFFLTLAVGVCVFYAFGSITDQTAVIQMAADQRRMVQGLADILSGPLRVSSSSSSGFSSSTPPLPHPAAQARGLASTSRWAWTSGTSRGSSS